ncbi:MAG: serine/threonine-protein phosphatase [Xanthomonadaceae bacterium]|nr:serine/threonine-protein phosphatase [Xanthomonadaceae bacterium]MDE1962591.1 serine/threonine-protein phosphatase [Xanthomonadaceae bacterium]
MEQQIGSTIIDAPSGGAVAAAQVRGGRPSQQDDMVCLHDPDSGTWLLVLADGMGGEGAGEQASAGVVSTARRSWARGGWRDLPGPVFLEQLCQDAHLELRRCGDALGGVRPHATVVALLLRDRHAYWAHAGDSRLYRLERGRLAGRTEDHSLVQERVRRGEIDPRDAATAPDQHQLLRGLGGARRPQVEHGFAPRRRDQQFALCSDGVWAYLSDDEVAAYASRPDPSCAVREALALVLCRGGDRGDNASLILVQVAPAAFPRLGYWRSAWARIRGVPGSRRPADAH